MIFFEENEDRGDGLLKLPEGDSWDRARRKRSLSEHNRNGLQKGRGRSNLEGERGGVDNG